MSIASFGDRLGDMATLLFCSPCEENGDNGELGGFVADFQRCSSSFAHHVASLR